MLVCVVVSLCYNAIIVFGAFLNASLRTGWERRGSWFDQITCGYSCIVSDGTNIGFLLAWFWMFCDKLAYIALLTSVVYIVYVSLWLVLGLLIYPARLIPYATAVVVTFGNAYWLYYRSDAYYRNMANDVLNAVNEATLKFARHVSACLPPLVSSSHFCADIR